MGVRKNILCIQRKPPHGTIHAQESLDVALIGAAFDQHISLAFIDDGVYQLLREQNTQASATKNFSATLRALGDHDIRTIYADADSLQARGIGSADLIDIHWFDERDGDEKSDVAKPVIKIVNRATLREIIDRQDTLLSF